MGPGGWGGSVSGSVGAAGGVAEGVSLKDAMRARLKAGGSRHVAARLLTLTTSHNYMVYWYTKNPGAHRLFTLTTTTITRLLNSTVLVLTPFTTE